MKSRLESCAFCLFLVDDLSDYVEEETETKEWNEQIQSCQRAHQLEMM